MKLVQVDKIPDHGFFVVTGIALFDTPFPFGESFYSDGDGRVYQYNNETDSWDLNITNDLYFNKWVDVKYFVIKED